ncbi:glycolate oxidase subunit GlcF [Telmatospirillum sp. J64-1]|uniref:glycolate oxidase subunit GlcF n=1 Tax=Telmatospirillum sp. J64-1 TaxID=2502183 RepID=UPI00115CB171|nr:glycolate oxidase subunit GlcF [Telmatospirillum sp. J64-1]
MQTNFTEAQRADPAIKTAEEILRKCVHCGFCTATCPTYVLLGDELDSPRGRIYLIKDMLENDRPATPEVVKHVDRCLSCLSCMSTCPSGVNYMHLIDHARAHVEKTYQRPLPERALRRMLSTVMPNPGLFRWAMLGGRLAKPFSALAPGRLKGLLGMVAGGKLAEPVKGRHVHKAEAQKKKRVALLPGCVQQVIGANINDATIRLLTRHDCEVVLADGLGCCGALVHHMGEEDRAKQMAKANITAWMREIEGEGLDAIVINASGCGTTVKDYGFLFKDDPEWAEPARRVAALARDITEVMTEIGLKPAVAGQGMAVAYHSACSLQHGQRVRNEPKALLAKAGFEVREIGESHLCCGSAGTYNLLQPELATQLRDRKVANIEATKPEAVAAGNIGCMVQIAGGTDIPVLHTAELLDWATGGPKPAGLR